MLTPGPTRYPPTTPAGFRRLLHAIHSTTRIDRLKRDCFLYYLVRDADAASRPAVNGDMDVDSSDGDDDDTPAASFARRRCLPRTWRIFMDGYWLLDHGRWAEAVAALSDPAISELNFVPEVVGALTTLVSPPSQALRLVYELLDARDLGSDVERHAALLAKASVAGMSAAFALIRPMDDPSARANGREAVWCWSLGAPRSPAGKGTYTAQPRALRELLHLAMHDEESAHLVSFLAHPPREITPPARSLLHDLVTLRLVHAGKYDETLALDRELAGTDAASAADRQRRREMVREFIDILPEAQRRILLGADYKRGAATANGAVNGAPDGDVDMSSSWVHVESTPQSALPPALSSLPAAPSTPAAPAIPPASYADVAASPPASAAPAAPAAPSTPGPIAPQPVRLAQRALGMDGTPARNGASSPFGGPPRFASPRPKAESSAVPSTSSRQTSPTRVPSPPAAPLRAPSPPRTTPRASPFVHATPSSSKPARKPKRVINDDGPSLRRSTRNRSEPPEDDKPSRATSRAPSEAPIPENALAPATRAKRATKKTEKAAEAETPRPRTRRGGASSRASTIEPAEDEDEDDIKIPGAFGETPARRTRNAAKANLDEPEATPAKRTRGKAATPATRKSTRAASEALSEVSEAPSATPVRRTRRAAASERGSPTPSVASTVGSPQKSRSTRTRRSRRAE